MPRWVGLAFLVLLSVPAGACGGAEEAEEATEVVVRVETATGESASDAQVRDGVEILERRLDALEVSGTVERGTGALVTVRIQGADRAKRDRVADVLTRSARLELFDLERNLVPPSIDENGFPVATSSLYDLLVGRQVPAREREVESWYLFDTDHRVAGGPAPTKDILLAQGALLGGWRILGVPPGRVVLECGVGEVVCPGVNVENPTSDSYYLVRFDPPDVPELSGAHVELDGTRQDFDTTTGEPIVTFQFTDEGDAKFAEVTRRLAERGRALAARSGGEPDPIAYFQHFAVVVDREIESWPSIDFEQYPDGIAGTAGVQISGLGSMAAAKEFAAVLQVAAGSLRLVEVSRRALD